MTELHNIHLRDATGRKQTVEILYQDEDILVVNKPAGLRVIPDQFVPAFTNVKTLLEAQSRKQGDLREQTIWTVHRIDMDTSGIVVFARHPEAHRELNRQFEENRVEKTYWAVVEGVFPESESEGEVDYPIDTGKRRGRVRIHERGKPALTRYRVLEQFRHFALLEVHPHTGRTHQIRVHLQAIGHPLAVDPLYHGVSHLTIGFLKTGRRQTGEVASAIISRLSLHAYRIQFQHPGSGEPVHFQAPLPKDFRALLNALRKWDKLY